jgi:ribosomal protein S18 acetylase RimI-like enzyme
MSLGSDRNELKKVANKYTMKGRTKPSISLEDIDFVKSLMRENSDSVGFIPTQGIKRAAAQNCLIVQRIKTKRVGYLLFGPVQHGKDVYIWQECVDKDVRRIGCGRDAFLKLYKRTVRLGAKGIRLRCAANLPANRFWQALGFRLVSTEKPINRRKRTINVYYLSLQGRDPRKRLELSTH